MNEEFKLHFSPGPFVDIVQSITIHTQAYVINEAMKYLTEDQKSELHRKCEDYRRALIEAKQKCNAQDNSRLNSCSQEENP